MSERLVLDAGPLSRACSPHRQRPANKAFLEWFSKQFEDGVEVCIAEIADYEVRRGLLRVQATAQLRLLDEIIADMTFLPLSRETTLLAAELWAEAQRKGIPTGHPHELDCDVFLAAQALLAEGVVVTENVGHLSRFVGVLDWRSTK